MPHENQWFPTGDTHLSFNFLQRIRTDPDLEKLRKSEKFDTLLKNYDESFINENALNAIKSLFGFGKQ